jgi:hypothetical protein
VNCTNLSDIINNAAPYVVMVIVVLGFAIVSDYSRHQGQR